MTDWTQFHPTRTVAAPDGREVDIDVEMVPLVRALWRFGFETKVACQDAGEAVREGGTRAAGAERHEASVRLAGRAWLVVRREDARHCWTCGPVSDGRTTGWCGPSRRTPHPRPGSRSRSHAH